MDDSQNTAGDVATMEGLVNVAGPSGIALDGYDPVAFFAEDESMHGDLNISATDKGATCFFVSKDHEDKFESDPEAYVPQYGGYCAFGGRSTLSREYQP